MSHMGCQVLAVHGRSGGTDGQELARWPAGLPHHPRRPAHLTDVRAHERDRAAAPIRSTA
eukprot:6193124-Pleurochrysis_carterae.AAC.5